MQLLPSTGQMIYSSQKVPGRMGIMAYGDSYFSRTTYVVLELKIWMDCVKEAGTLTGSVLDQSFALTINFEIVQPRGYFDR